MMIAENDAQNLNVIFNSMFRKLEEISLNDNFIREISKRREKLFDESLPDSYFYEILVRDIHNAGMKAVLVTKKWPAITEAFSEFNIGKVSKYGEENIQNLMNNLAIIRHERKLRACVHNAKKMKELSEEFGSFGEFLKQSNANPAKLRHELTLKFKYLGDILVLDYLKDIGIDVIKPDVHVLRLFFRLGFTKSRESTKDNINRIMDLAERTKQETAEKMAVIDAVFWIYGGGGDGHVKKAICKENGPVCYECPLTNYCRFYKEESRARTPNTVKR
jgi:DNA-3-methyladenine glycosylase I